MDPLKAAREHLDSAVEQPYVDAEASNRIKEALGALEDIQTAYYVGRVVLMRPMIVHQAIHDWYVRVGREGKIYTASGDTAAEALTHLADEVFGAS